MKGRLAVLILLLATALTLASVDYEISKVEKYAESVEDSIQFAIDGVQGQLNFEFDALRKENKKLNKEFKSLIAKERDKTNRILGIDGKYDTNNILLNRKDLDTFLNYRVYAGLLVIFRVRSEGKEDITFMPPPSAGAPAIVIGKYVLTASHVNDKEFIKDELFPKEALSRSGMSVEIVGHAVMLQAGDRAFELREIYRNREKDFSLFELPENATTQNFPFAVGKSDELKVGDFIYINGRPGIPFEVARPGYITATAIIPGVNDSKSIGQVEISQSSDSGDSGSPIIAFRDGKPELVGVYLGWLSYNSDNGKNTRSRALKIDVAIDEIKEKLGVDLREIQRQILKK